MRRKRPKGDYMRLKRHKKTQLGAIQDGLKLYTCKTQSLVKALAAIHSAERPQKQIQEHEEMVRCDGVDITERKKLELGAISRVMGEEDDGV